MSLPVKCRITCLRVNIRELENLCITFDDFVVHSVACNSDSEILAAFQTIETVVRTSRHRLYAYPLPIFSAG